MLERSARAKYASSVFYEDLNDFDVYIEDTADGYAKLFAIILGRALTSHVSVTKVFPLGDRRKVLEAADFELKKEQKRKSVFIIDGDLFLLSGERQDLPKNTIRLPRYCIENFLIDAEAFIELLDEECPNKERDTLKKEFNFDGWRSASLDPLVRLFTSFAVSHMLRTGVKTIANGSSSICLNDMGDICNKKAEKLASDTDKSSTEIAGGDATQASLELIRSKVDMDCCFVSTYVSGKDFLLPLLFARFRKVSKSKSSNILLKQRLARKCDLQPLLPVVHQMEKILSTPNLIAA